MFELEGKDRVQIYPTKVSDNPIVSVCVQTYNHENYIPECLDGILMQECDFDFEILLGEDDSSDKTREICIDYAEKYPGKIRLFLHNRKNVIYIEGNPTGRYNMLYNLEHAKGKYIALCEGDDYWTDPLKLQKQVDFLEENDEYSICFHDVDMVDENGFTINDNISIANNYRKKSFSQDEIINLPYLANTLSYVYRNNINVPNWILQFPYGDKPLFKLIGLKGKAYYLENVMAMYRNHSQSISKSNLFRYNNMYNSLKLDIKLHKYLIIETNDNKLIETLVKKVKWDEFRISFYNEKATLVFRVKRIIKNMYQMKYFGKFNLSNIALLIITKGTLRKVLLSIIYRLNILT